MHEPCSEWIVQTLLQPSCHLQRRNKRAGSTSYQFLRGMRKYVQALGNHNVIYRTFDCGCCHARPPCECLTEAILLAERAESASNETELH